MDKEPPSGIKNHTGLLENEQHFRTLAENLGEGVAIVDPEETFIYCNPAAEVIFGTEPNTLVGQNLLIFLSPKQAEIIQQQTLVRKAGQKSQYEIEITRPDGKARQLLLTATPWLDKEGKYIGSFGVFHDITENFLAEENLRQSEERYRAIVEDQSELIFRFQPNGIITFVNEAFCRYFQRLRESIMGTNLMTFVLREDRGVNRSQFISLTPACPAVSYEIRVQRPQGDTAWLQRTDRAIFDSSGKAIEYQSVCTDITERRAAEQALKHQLALEEIVTQISTRFINVAPQEMDTEIKRALKSLGEFSEVDRCFLLLMNTAETHLEEGYEWTSERVYSSHPLVKKGGFPISEWMRDGLCRREVVNLPSANQLTPDAALEKELWRWIGFKSFIGLPLLIENSLAGFFGLSTEINEREWSPEILSMLRMVGEVFINVLVRKKSLQALGEAQSQLNQRIKELEQRTHEINMLSEMSNMLQIANHVEEAYAIICQYTMSLFKNTSGCLYLLDPILGYLTIKGQWGQFSPVSHIQVEDCWGLRRGRMYRVAHAGLFCKHIHPQNNPNSTICVPVATQSNTIALLHIQTSPLHSPLTESDQTLASAVAEQVGLVLSNLQLREDLRQQAIRDHLTGLYNRYYMEASLEQELNRSQRNGRPVSLIMLDIDHFKAFNDTYQHQAGDELLRELGHLIQGSVRSGDIACRYGGEEFLLIMPDTPQAAAVQRADHLRLLVKGLRLENEHQAFPPITISLGVACWPDHGHSVKDLLKAADDAMYKAKNNGRDQVASAG